MKINDLFLNPIMNLDSHYRYSNIHTIIRENVAEHSELVANIALILAIEFNKNKKIFDLRDLAYRAVIHDWGESVTCDVTTDIKHGYEGLAELLDNIEKKELGKIINEDILNDVVNSKSKDSISGYLIEVSDKTTAFIKLWREYLIQRTQYLHNIMIRNANNLIDLIEGMKSYEDDSWFIQKCNELINSINVFIASISMNTELV